MSGNEFQPKCAVLMINWHIIDMIGQGRYSRWRVTATGVSAIQELALQPSAIGFGFPRTDATQSRPYPLHSLSTGQLVNESTHAASFR